MHKRIIFLVMGIALVMFGCSEEQDSIPLAPQSAPEVGTDPEALALALITEAGWPLDDSNNTGTPVAEAHGQIHFPFQMQREVLVDDVVHYSFEIPVGCNSGDVIRLHRVVRERRPFRPIRTNQSIMLQHGDGLGFTKFIFGHFTPYISEEQSLAVYLAMNDIDVWGIDQNWILVEGGLEDYSFTADWGIQNQVDNLRIAMAVARFSRLLTGGGFGKMHLLGYSSGGFTGYAYLNEESQLPLFRQHVKGFIAAESMLKADESDPRFELARQYNCEYAAYYLSELDAGNYDIGWGPFFVELGYLGETAPDDPSPYYPELTNLQATIAIGSTPDPTGFSPWYHYLSGIYDDGVPVGLRYTSEGAWLDFMQEFVPFGPMRFIYEYSAVICDEVDLPYDDYLHDISIPVLYLGAAGGFGEAGYHTLDLLGSADKSIINVSLNPPEDDDFGHIDIWVADNAPIDVWSQMLEWIENH